MRPATVLLALLAGAGAMPAAGAAATPAFATPAGLERDVAFWTRVYTDVRTTAGLLHDDRNLAVVYEVLVFPDGLDREGRGRMVEQARARYVPILRTLAEGKRDGLTAEEARVLALWGDNVQARTLELAVDRIRFQLGQSDRFREGLSRAARWERHLAATFAARDLPGELASLPHVESSFDPRAGSKVGAAGLWQFMPSTGRRWLRVDSVVDERYDPYKSTVAAAQYLQLNYSVLGTWPLALTAYNHGASGMRRAKEMMGTDDIVTIVRYYTSPSFGFASRNFYVSFLAALDVDRHAERYFGPYERDPLDDSVVVPLPAYIPVAALERAFAIDRDQLQNLNPALRGAVWSGRRSVPKGFELRVPPRAGLDPAALLSGLRPTDKQDAQASDAFHTVRRGETLGGIAAKHGVSQAWLVRHNDLKAGGRHIRVGQVLRLPGRMPVMPVPAEPATAGDLYVVARGDTLSEIAQKTGLTERDLMERNGLKDRDSLFVGQRLRLVAAVPAAPRADEEAGELLAEERRAESESQVTRREEEQPLTIERSSNPGTQPAAGAMSADPSDYSVAPDGSVVVAGAETLGHLADWLGIRAQRLRELNGMKQGQPLSAGRRLRLDLSVVDAATFEKRRTAYHRELQEQFFSAWRVVGTETHTVRSGESLWTLTQRRRNLPVWLLRQYNLEVNLEDLRPGTRVTLPMLEAANGQGG